MSRFPTLTLALESFDLSREKIHHGLRLAAAVLLGYFVAVLIGLPERFWVVITVLIVMRADADSALAAGWERARGTVLGSVIGLLGVVLHHYGANSTLISLTIISSLAFASAAVPMLRSAAVAALIILGAGELAGHSIVHVALLRVLQITIGIAVSMALVLSTAKLNTRSRLLATCATLLGRLALQLQMHGARSEPTETEAETNGAAMRSALLGLATLANSADKKFPWSQRQAVPRHERHHRRIAALTNRLVQDTLMMNRVMRLLSHGNEGRLAHTAATTASAALKSVVNTLKTKVPASLATLRQLAESCATRDTTGTALLAAPLRLLLEDLQQFCASIGATADASATTTTHATTIPADS